MTLFPLMDHLPMYVGFTLLVLVVLVLDLGVFHRKPHAVKFREAAAWSVFWVALALVFNVFFYWYALHHFTTSPEFLALPDFDAQKMAKQSALEFLTGYVVEKSLAVDNLFVFMTVFSYFAIPAKYQHRILFYGILGALVFRAIFIAMGSYLMQYHAVVIFFGVFLIITGIKLIFTEEGEKDLSNNAVLKLLKRIFPVTHHIHDARFFVRENGKLFVTPLFIALLFLEFSDIIFAVDSVPAIFAITKEPLIVFTSNICAILGLRAMYFMLAGVSDQFHYLKYGLAAVLIFVGLKMTWLNSVFDGKFPISWSLGLIALFIGSSVILSLLYPKPYVEPSPNEIPDEKGRLE